MLSKNLKYYRLLNKYSCQEVTDKLGLSSGMVTRYESGQRHVPEEVINKYCELFGVTPNELYGYNLNTTKHSIPLYEVIFKNKSPVGLNLVDSKKIDISYEKYYKGYSFAIQAFNMDNNPVIFTGDLLYFKKDLKLIDSDVILLLDENNKPQIRVFNKFEDNIKLSAYSHAIKNEFYTSESFKKIEVLGRLVEVNSYFKKGGNPWPNGK